VKITTSTTLTHNPCGEADWASGLRENLTSRSYGEGLETGRILIQAPRQSFTRQITIRDSNAFAGFGQDQCRKRERVVGANTLRLLLAAARTLWFVEQTSRAVPFALQRSRPWYRQKCAPSQLDIVWACREVLQDAGVFPIPRFTPDLAINQEKPEIALPLAA
jgi:hypothetical protein